jgi:anti-sigma factor ChrR (cupin superfamily)
MSDYLDALERAAKGAFAKGWTCNATEMAEVNDGEHVGYCAVARTHEHDGSDEGHEAANGNAAADATFIATASPDVVLALVDEVRRLRRVEAAARTVDRAQWQSTAERQAAMFSLAEAEGRSTDADE